MLPLAVVAMAWANVVVPPAHAAPDTQATPLQLGLPVKCDMTRDCSIQKYVDRDAGPERLDYRCGTLTTNGHDGVDFRIRRSSDFGKNIPVAAAAAGTVLRVRDTMPDISVKDPAAPALGKRLAGNAVVISHGDGWVTQYSHLKRGSIRVAAGEHIGKGAIIGAIGMSGNAEFPHLHFEVRHKDETIDPFAADTSEGCTQQQTSLWDEDTTSILTYKATVTLFSGFSATVSQALTGYQKTIKTPTLVNPDTLILWGVTSGIQSGDVEKFEIYDPKRGVILKREIHINKNNLQRVGYAGMRRPPQGWISGEYVGKYLLLRDGKIIGELSSIQSVMGN